MKIVPQLVDWDIPIKKPQALIDNCRVILEWFPGSHFIGIGHSGTTILSALACMSILGRNTVNKFSILKKPEVQSSTVKSLELTKSKWHDKNLVIVDDHIHDGRTLRTIQKVLKHSAEILCDDSYTERVVGIAALDFHYNYSGLNREELIKSLFPNCKLWLK